MKKGWIATSLLLVMVLSGYWQGCGDKGGDGNSDCAEFNPPAKTKNYGQTCGSFTYGTCPTKFDDCAQGACTSTSNGSVCTKACNANADCPSGLPFCAANNSGTKVCTAGCTSHTYCDGTLCCSYYPDPSDPTQCKQGSCSAPQFDLFSGNATLLIQPNEK